MHPTLATTIDGTRRHTRPWGAGAAMTPSMSLQPSGGLVPRSSETSGLAPPSIFGWRVKMGRPDRILGERPESDSWDAQAACSETPPSAVLCGCRRAPSRCSRAGDARDQGSLSEAQPRTEWRRSRGDERRRADHRHGIVTPCWKGFNPKPGRLRRGSR